MHLVRWISPSAAFGDIRAQALSLIPFWSILRWNKVGAAPPSLPRTSLQTFPCCLLAAGKWQPAALAAPWGENSKRNTERLIKQMLLHTADHLCKFY